MRTRSIIVSVAAALAALSLAACSASKEDAIVTSETPANTAAEQSNGAGSVTTPEQQALPTTTAAPAAPPAALQIESGMTSGVDSINTRHTSAGAVLTNPNPKAAYDVDVVFNLKDAAGNVIDTDDAKVVYIPAGGKRIVAPLQIGYDIPAEPASLEVVAVVGDFAEDKGPDGNPAAFSLPETRLNVTTATIQPGSYGTKIVGQLANPGSDVVKYAGVDCVLRAGGTLVGGESGGVSSPIVPGGTVAFDVHSSFRPANADSVECESSSR